MEGANIRCMAVFGYDIVSDILNLTLILLVLIVTQGAMDIFNRPPSISEDTLHYELYPPPQSSDKASVTSLAACIHEYVDGLLPNFIWHRDGFELKTTEDSDAKSWFLEGHMRVGDCVDDEWCVVWLLREISSKWDLVIRFAITALPSIYLLADTTDGIP